MEKEQLKIKSIENKIFLIIGLCILLLGGLMNVLALTVNEGRMPILTEHHNLENKDYFTYQNKEDVRRWYLTDIIPIGKIFYLSIGDLFIILGATQIIISIIKLKEKKQ